MRDTESKLGVNRTCAPRVYKGHESESRGEGTVMRRSGSGDYSQVTHYLWEETRRVMMQGSRLGPTARVLRHPCKGTASRSSNQTPWEDAHGAGQMTQ